MKIVKAGFEIMDPLNGEEILKKMARYSLGLVWMTLRSAYCYSLR